MKSLKESIIHQVNESVGHTPIGRSQNSFDLDKIKDQLENAMYGDKIIVLFQPAHHETIGESDGSRTYRNDYPSEAMFLTAYDGGLDTIESMIEKYANAQSTPFDKRTAAGDYPCAMPYCWIEFAPSRSDSKYSLYIPACGARDVKELQRILYKKNDKTFGSRYDGDTDDILRALEYIQKIIDSLPVKVRTAFRDNEKDIAYFNADDAFREAQSVFGGDSHYLEHLISSLKELANKYNDSVDKEIRRYMNKFGITMDDISKNIDINSLKVTI